MAQKTSTQTPPRQSMRLKRDHGHELYIERHGTQGKLPTLFLHGGPGGGLSLSSLKGFDLERHDLVLFDQRGCGRSTPLAELKANTTHDLIADIEAIRERLGIDQWMIAGGSWGSFLSLAYAQSHPERVLGIRVHGIFLGGEKDIDWWFNGIRHIYPDEWEKFAAHIPLTERDNLLNAYYQRVTNPDPNISLPSAWQLRHFSARTQTFAPDEDHIERLLASPDTYLPVARLFTHYCMHHAFMPEGALLNNIQSIRHIPTEIVQARYDMVTPVESAWRLHKRWPEANFTLVTHSNHVASVEMQRELYTAANRLVDRIEDDTSHKPSCHFLNTDGTLH